jgi:hypothetical protein
VARSVAAPNRASQQGRASSVRMLSRRSGTGAANRSCCCCCWCLRPAEEAGERAGVGSVGKGTAEAGREEGGAAAAGGLLRAC